MPTHSTTFPLLNSRVITPLLIMGLRGSTLIAKFALTLFIARFVGLESLGVYGLIAGATVMLPVVLGLGLINTLGRNAVTQTLSDVTGMLRQYWRTQAGIYGIAMLLTIVCGLAFGRPLLAVTIIVIVSLEHINGDVFVLLNLRRQPRLANVLMFIRTTLWIAAFIALALIYPSLRNLQSLLGFWIGGCVLAVFCFGFATHDWPWRNALSTAPDRRWLWGQFRSARILYVNDIANTVGQYLDRYLVGLFLGLELTGVYVLFWSIGNALSNLIGTGVIQIAEPYLIDAHKQQDASYWRLFDRLLRETVLGSLALAGAAGILFYYALPYLQRPMVADWLPVFWLILCGFVLRMAYEAQGIIFYSRHEDRLTLAIGLFVLGLSAATNAALVPLFALYGAATAIIVCYFAGTLARYVLIARRRR